MVYSWWVFRSVGVLGQGGVAGPAAAQRAVQGDPGLGALQCELQHIGLRGQHAAPRVFQFGQARRPGLLAGLGALEGSGVARSRCGRVFLLRGGAGEGEQGLFHLACKKFTQAGDKVKAMKALIKSGDAVALEARITAGERNGSITRTEAARFREELRDLSRRWVDLEARVSMSR